MIEVFKGTIAWDFGMLYFFRQTYTCLGDLIPPFHKNLQIFKNTPFNPRMETKSFQFLKFYLVKYKIDAKHNLFC